MIRKIVLFFTLLNIWFAPHLKSQGVLEEFIVASENTRFFPIPLIRENLIIWQRYPKPPKTPDNPGLIQCKDISNLSSPIIDVALYPWDLLGVFLSSEYLFRGAQNDFLDGRPIVARRLTDLSAGEQADIHVSDFGRVVAANRNFIFIKVEHFERKPFNSKYHAKSASRLADQSPDSLKFVAGFRSEFPRGGASETYFVWTDRDPAVKDSTWKIYAKRAEDFFTPGSERVVIDTMVLDTLSPDLAIHENLILFQKGQDKPVLFSETGMYLLNLDKGGEPIPIEVPPPDSFPPDDPAAWIYINVQSPTISGEYAVWVRNVWTPRDNFRFTPYAIRLEDGEPVGEKFEIANHQTGGYWIRIDKNIVVWSGSRLVEGEFVSTAIFAAELPLPGAEDVGDVDQNGAIEITDPILILQYLFLGGWQPRIRPSDADQNGLIELSDAVQVFRYLFLGEKRPGT